MRELLVKDAALGFDLIVEAVLSKFPEAKTMRRSLARALRRKGVEVVKR